MEQSLKEKFSLGDILFVNRGLYQHYGIYAGRERVIHYADKLGDFGNDICIQEVNLEAFAKGAEIKICNLPPSIKQYTGVETVKRARSRLGEEEYSLIFNNCEHFAVWCKTGISDSSQVNKVLKGAAYVAAGFTLAVAIYGILKNIDTDGEA